MGRFLDRYKEGTPRRARRGLGARSSASSRTGSHTAVLRARREVQKRMELRQRLGLLKGKGEHEQLSDVEQKMFDHELAIARDLQAHLLPRKLPDIKGWDVSAYYKASREVGGDYYDFIEVDASHVGIAVADVSGKGIPASMVMSEARVLMRTHAVGETSPKKVLTAVNRFLYQDIMRGMFVTLFYFVYDRKSRTLTMCSAGHNPMIYYRKANQTCYLINPSGIALGIDRGALFDNTLKEQRLKLNEGDRIFLYTDGAIEVFDEDRNPYAEERLYKLVRDHADQTSSELIRTVVADIEAHQGQAPQHDDITMVTVRLVPGGSPYETTFENLL